MLKHRARILAVDAGGTMTDTFIVDELGRFVVGKAQTTPENESIGLIKSAEDALCQWDTTTKEAFPHIVAGIYSGTTMLNRLLSRQGLRVGVIVSKGQEDYFLLERGVQTYLGFSYADRLHVVTHHHNDPIVPGRRVRGVFGRIDVFGEEVLPLQEGDARDMVRQLLDEGIEALCVCLLHSYRNPSHEQRIDQIAGELMDERGMNIPVFLSSEYYPVRNDFPRLNTTVIEAYAAQPSRAQLQLVTKRFRECNGKFETRVMASHGGTVGIDTKELARTLISGPIGGVLGARYLARAIGSDDVVCTDIGGTSFDLALVTGGDYAVKPYPDLARFLLCIPMIQIDSVGAGTGSFLRINPGSGRIEIGPDSAGARIGVCWPEGEVTTPTITDCSVALGILDPDYFLGGEIKLDRDRALAAIKDQLADPLHIDVYKAAEGIIELFEENLKGYVASAVLSKGYAPSNYVLLSYGGGGPVHVAGYTKGLDFQDILVPAWAAGFSAYGCACGDFEYRYEATTDLPVPPGSDDDWKVALCTMLNMHCEGLKAKIVAEFEKTTHGSESIEYKTFFRIQYMGQLNDLEIRSPSDRLETARDLDDLLQSFEETYGRVYARAAKSPELGFAITQAIVTGRVDVEKPRLPDETPAGPTPPEAAFKGERKVYWKGEWRIARILDMEALESGNIVEGLAIMESPATTFVIPPGATAELDSHRLFHLRFHQNERDH
ncbi:MAG: hydantoinase/oxoprolinase family protein [Desulfobacteraceae bacterium]|nr:hydantoinase/oxoprolinase family protein [Desulfobacteraceae bacterium]MBC2756262.1 hydantoinase/oxoprolinase family protein [Desulfobacteraceae bacterium]